MSNELLLMVDALSRDKGVEKEVIFEALEAALATALRAEAEVSDSSGLLAAHALELIHREVVALAEPLSKQEPIDAITTSLYAELQG